MTSYSSGRRAAVTISVSWLTTPNCLSPGEDVDGLDDINAMHLKIAQLIYSVPRSRDCKVVTPIDDEGRLSVMDPVRAARRQRDRLAEALTSGGSSTNSGRT
jgi:hypothetical protein